MDWNLDGKQDYKDHAIYNNLISENKQNDSAQIGYKSKPYSQQSNTEKPIGFGSKLFLIVCIIVCLLGIFAEF